MQPVHDLGGLPIHDPVDRNEHPYTFLEKRIDAMMRLLYGPCALFKVDEMRRAIESLSPEEYEHLTYYQKWLKAMRALLLEKGVLQEAELEKRIDAVQARMEAERRDTTPLKPHIEGRK